MAVISCHSLLEMCQIPPRLPRISLCVRRTFRDKGKPQLVLHIDAFPVAGVQKIFAWGIMGCPYIIAVCFFKEAHILVNHISCQASSMERRDFMAADAPQLDLFAVYIDPVGAPFNLAKSKSFPHCFQYHSSPAYSKLHCI